MQNKPKKQRFLFSGYILSLLCFVLTGCTVGCLWSMHGCYTQSAPNPPTTNDWACVIFIGSILICLYATVIIFSREFASWYTATENEITLHALFRRPLTLRYEDVKYIGIGKNWLSVNYAFWIYLSMDPVPLEQLNDMRKFRLTRRGMRIAYSKKVYDTLRELLPAHLSKELQRHQTTLRAHKHSE